MREDTQDKRIDSAAPGSKRLGDERHPHHLHLAGLYQIDGLDEDAKPEAGDILLIENPAGVLGKVGVTTLVSAAPSVTAAAVFAAINTIPVAGGADRTLKSSGAANILGGTTQATDIDLQFKNTLSGTGNLIWRNHPVAGRFEFAQGVELSAGIVDSNANLLLSFGTALQSEKPFKILEAANAVADTAAYGQFWVKNDAPCTAWFTDDVGTDVGLVTAAAALGANTLVMGNGSRGLSSTSIEVAFGSVLDGCTGFRSSAGANPGILGFTYVPDAVNYFHFMNQVAGNAPVWLVFGEANIGMQIWDSNNREMLVLAPVASAVPYVEISNAIAGNPALITAKGEANAALTIGTSGTGAITLDAATTVVGALSVDTISERTGAAGVTIENVLLKNGRVGVGTATPLQHLHISTSGVPAIRLSDSGAPTDQGVATLIELYRGNNTNRVGYWGMASASNDVMALATDYTAGEISLKTGANVERLRISSTGNFDFKAGNLTTTGSLLVGGVTLGGDLDMGGFELVDTTGDLVLNSPSDDVTFECAGTELARFECTNNTLLMGLTASEDPKFRIHIKRIGDPVFALFEAQSNTGADQCGLQFRKATEGPANVNVGDRCGGLFWLQYSAGAYRNTASVRTVAVTAQTCEVILATGSNDAAMTLEPNRDVTLEISDVRLYFGPGSTTFIEHDAANGMGLEVPTGKAFLFTVNNVQSLGVATTVSSFGPNGAARGSFEYATAGQFVMRDSGSNAAITLHVNEIGFFGVAPVTRPDIVGARDVPEEALADLLTKGALLGLWTDSTTAS